MKNYMPQVAKMLGVEVEQTFKIKGWYADAPDDSVYKFTENDFCFYNEETGVWEGSLRYTDIIDGGAVIIEIPFEPKNGKRYYMFTFSGGEFYLAETVFDEYCIVDLTNVYCGNCFGTKEEAQKHKVEIYEKLTGRKWEKK